MEQVIRPALKTIPEIADRIDNRMGFNNITWNGKAGYSTRIDKYSFLTIQATLSENQIKVTTSIRPDQYAIDRDAQKLTRQK
jgi:hypothetical protein